ncbi:hypothetical protein [Kitasatospora sp. NPDC088783]|uniref:hypothetical protein n=1 Tax=Kitasatospora sp. NPDC088783 TaxID=3364077 RepID=UPI00381A0778
MAGLDAAAHLTVLAILTWAEQPGKGFFFEPDAAARTAGLHRLAFEAAVAHARTTGALAPCTALPNRLLRCDRPSAVNPWTESDI